MNRHLNREVDSMGWSSHPTDAALMATMAEAPVEKWEKAHVLFWAQKVFVESSHQQKILEVKRPNRALFGPMPLTNFDTAGLGK